MHNVCLVSHVTRRQLIFCFTHTFCNRLRLTFRKSHVGQEHSTFVLDSCSIAKGLVAHDRWSDGYPWFSWIYSLWWHQRKDKREQAIITSEDRTESTNIWNDRKRVVWFWVWMHRMWPSFAPDPLWYGLLSTGWLLQTSCWFWDSEIFKHLHVDWHIVLVCSITRWRPQTLFFLHRTSALHWWKWRRGQLRLQFHMHISCQSSARRFESTTRHKSRN